ncbi:hypothetical protein K710_1907 [Streptococcus iniae SF1]|nr:hypothetical protein K710_1907 [Streptococcus iniae SF1]
MMPPPLLSYQAISLMSIFSYQKRRFISAFLTFIASDFPNSVYSWKI